MTNQTNMPQRSIHALRADVIRNCPDAMMLEIRGGGFQVVKNTNTEVGYSDVFPTRAQAWTDAAARIE